MYVFIQNIINIIIVIPVIQYRTSTVPNATSCMSQLMIVETGDATEVSGVVFLKQVYITGQRHPGGSV